MQNFHLIQLDRKVGHDFVVVVVVVGHFAFDVPHGAGDGQLVIEFVSLLKYQFCISITLFVQN